MCGRASLTKTEKELEERFHAEFYSEDLERYNPLPSFNIAPTHMHPVLTNDDPEHLLFYRWGLIPFWAKDKKIGSRMINARIETVAEKGSFKHALKSRRCLVPFDGFYEWKKTPEGKQPYRIVTNNQEIFCIAGLWEKWKSPGNEEIYSFTLITMPSNEKIGELHDRMPALLAPDRERDWIDMDVPPKESLDLLEPYPDEWIDMYPVSKRVNNVRENDPELIKPVDAE
jgi:putative SOS response-associated peptidase YedK